MKMLWQLFFVFLFFIHIIFKWKKRKMIALSKRLTTKKVALPIIGHGHQFIGSNEDRMTVLKEYGQEAIREGGLVSFWHGSRLFIVIADPVSAQVVLKTCLEKDDIAKFIKDVVGGGSIFAPVSIWRPRRKVSAPIFSHKNLNAFVSIFARQSGIMTKQLKSAAGKGAFSVWKNFTTYTMDSVCETTLGTKLGSQQQPKLPFLYAFETWSRLAAKRICQPWLFNDNVYKYFCHNSNKQRLQSIGLIWNFMDKVISQKQKDLNQQTQDINCSQMPKNSLKTFLELLIESSGGEKGYNNVELREEALVIVLAGTDTSAVGAAFTTVMLAKHPDVQDKVYRELQDVFGDSDRPVAAEDLPHLKYLDAVIKETLRLYPPVPGIVRQVKKDVTLPSGITLVEGCGIYVSIWAIHRNPHYWGADAEQFRPERFIETSLNHPAAFMPFSHGPRNCLGYQYAMMSMKTALATLLRQYRVSESGLYNDKELRVKFDVMMKDVHNFVVKLDLRT